MSKLDFFLACFLSFCYTGFAAFSLRNPRCAQKGEDFIMKKSIRFLDANMLRALACALMLCDHMWATIVMSG